MTRAKNSSKILALEYSEIKERLIEEFALRSCCERDLVMPSGRIVNHDIEISTALLNSEVGLLASLAILHNLQEEVEVVGGSTERAQGLVSALTQVAFLRARDLDAFLIRSQPKQTHKNKWLEGQIPEQSKVCIVHDIVVDGVQLINAIRTLKDEINVEIVQAIALVDRLDGSHDRLRDLGIDFTAICTMDEILRKYQYNRRNHKS